MCDISHSKKRQYPTELHFILRIMRPRMDAKTVRKDTEHGS